MWFTFLGLRVSGAEIAGFKTAGFEFGGERLVGGTGRIGKAGLTKKKA